MVHVFSTLPPKIICYAYSYRTRGPGAVPESVELDCLTLLYFTLIFVYQVLVKVKDKVEVALLYFVCIALLQKDSCARLLYFTLQNVIKHIVVVVVVVRSCGGVIVWWYCVVFSNYNTTPGCLTLDWVRLD